MLQALVKKKKLLFIVQPRVVPIVSDGSSRFYGELTENKYKRRVECEAV